MNPFDATDDLHHHGIQKRDGIQSDRPVEPWEMPGYFRLDCEPHRGPVLLWMAIPSMLAGAFGVHSLAPVLAAALRPRVTTATDPTVIALVLLVVSFLGLLLGRAAWARSRRDLVAMTGGRVDPSGHQATVEARRFAFIGFVLNGVTAPVYATIAFQVLIQR